MSKTVVGVYSSLDGLPAQFALESAPPGARFPLRRLKQLGCKANDPEFVALTTPPLSADAVRTAGERLRRSLYEHVDVKGALQFAFNSATTEVMPIYLQVDVGEAEALPWEVLCDEAGKFVSLSGRWPIARVAGVPDPSHVIERTFEPPLRVLAVLSAAAVPALEEWRAIYAPFKAMTEFPLELRVYVGEQKLRNTIRRAARADPRIEVVDWVGHDGDELLDKVQRFNPHLLHFFCHGSLEGGAHLEIATRSDWLGDKATGGIKIFADKFRKLVHGGSETCVVALNCCEGAARGEASSLALSLVDQGFPSVIGMREAVASADAHVFSEAFYQDVVDYVARLATEGKPVTEDQWAAALHRPREQLVGDDPLKAEGRKEWTLPIVYVRPERFKLWTRPVRPELTPGNLRNLRNELYSLRRGLGILENDSTTPDHILAEVRAKIEKAEADLYAD